MAIPTIWKLIKSGKLHGKKKSNEWFVSKGSLEKYLQERSEAEGVRLGCPYYIGLTLRISGGENERIENQQERLLRRVRRYCRSKGIAFMHGPAKSNLIIGKDRREAKNLHRRYGLKKIIRHLLSGKMKYWFVENTDRLSKGLFDVYESIANMYGCELIAFDRIGKSTKELERRDSLLEGYQVACAEFGRRGQETRKQRDMEFGPLIASARFRLRELRGDEGERLKGIIQGWIHSYNSGDRSAALLRLLKTLAEIEPTGGA